MSSPNNWSACRARSATLAGALVLALLQSACGLADEAPGEPLWEATFKGTSVSFFGTIHSLPLSEARASFPRALERFDGRGTLYVESDMASAEAGEAIRIAGLRTSDEPGLDTELSSEEWARLTDAVKQAVPEAELRRMRPWLASTLYGQLVAPLVDAEGKPIVGMDQAMVQEARLAGVEVRFLERPLSATLALDDGTSIDDLKATLASGPEGLKSARRELEEAWKAGRLDTIAETTRKLPALQRKELFDDRNTSWGVTLPETLADAPGPVFVAAGLGHFIVGESNSFPAVLRLFNVPVARVAP